jgi:hypothetical protein
LLLAIPPSLQALVYKGHTSPSILRNSHYYPLWVFQKLALLLFYCTISCSTITTLKPDLFTPLCLGLQ